MTKIIKQNFFIIITIILSILMALIFYLPSMRLQFSLIDDGHIVLATRQISNSIVNLSFNDDVKNLLFEENEGRVRPAYWIMQFLITSISFENPQVMHFVRILFLVVTLYFMVKILRTQNVRNVAIFVGLFFFVFNFHNFENYYRLGPTEVYLGFYYIYLIYVISKNKIEKFDYLFTFLFLIFGIFTKETFFLIVLPYLYLLALKSLDTRSKKYMIFVLIFTSILTSVLLCVKGTYAVEGGYSDNYKVNIVGMATNMLNYVRQIFHYQFPFPYIYILYILYFIYHKFRSIFLFKDKKDILFVFLTLQVVINLLILIPWQYVLGRYLIIVNLSLSLVYALILHDILNKINKRYSNKYILYVYLVLYSVLLPVMFVRNIFQIGNYQQWQKVDSLISSDSINSIARNIPKNTDVYVNYKRGDSNIEMFVESQWHLFLFHNREDIKIRYIDELNICTDEKAYIFDRTSDRYYEAEDLIEMQIIDNNKYKYQPLVYGEVLKSFIKGSKTPNWHLNFDFDWTLYLKDKKLCI